MAWSLDARIPLTLVEDAAALAAALVASPKSAVLAEFPAPPAGGAVAQEAFDAARPHAIACACCGGRPAAATALDRLFQARLRGRCGWFDRVLALVGTEAARAQVTAALTGDAVTAARFRLA